MSATTLSKSKLIYITAVAIRLAVFGFPSVSNTLVQRVELSTPVTSFKRCMYIFHIEKKYAI